jgi:hypothetical protein
MGTENAPWQGRIKSPGSNLDQTPVPVGQWGTLHTLRDGSQHLFLRIGLVIQGGSERALEVAAFQSNLTE